MSNILHRADVRADALLDRHDGDAASAYRDLRADAGFCSLDDQTVADRVAAACIRRAMETPPAVHAGASPECIAMRGVRCCEFGSDR